MNDINQMYPISVALDTVSPWLLQFNPFTIDCILTIAQS